MNSFWGLGWAVEGDGPLHHPGVTHETATVIVYDAPNRVAVFQLDAPPRRQVRMYDMAYKDLNMGVPHPGQRVVLRAAPTHPGPGFVLIGFSLWEDEV